MLRNKWKELGPLNIDELIAGDKLYFNPDYKIETREIYKYEGQVDSRGFMHGLGRVGEYFETLDIVEG